MELVETKLYWAEFCTYRPDNKIEEHSHEFYHYIYVVKGSGDIYIDGEIRKFKPKHLYLLSPGKVHSFHNNTNDNLVTIEIKFEVVNEEAKKRLSLLSEIMNMSETPVKRIFTNIKREYTNKKFNYKKIITMNMNEVFAHLERVEKTKANDNKTDFNQELVKVMEYIDENLEKDITLQELANVLCLEKTYFLKKFKTAVGITPMAYIRNVRIEKAKEFLKYSDMNITQIAETVGFISVHHFSNCFSKYIGTSPSKFKNENSI